MLLAAMLANVLAINEIHHQVRASAIQRARGTERYQRGMPQPSQQPPFTPKACCSAATGTLHMNQLHCHQFAGFRFATELHHAGATATDHGHPSARTANLTAAEAEALFARVTGDDWTPADAELFRAQMLTEMAKMSVEDAW